MVHWNCKLNFDISDTKCRMNKSDTDTKLPIIALVSINRLESFHYTPHYQIIQKPDIQEQNQQRFY